MHIVGEGPGETPSALRCLYCLISNFLTDINTQLKTSSGAVFLSPSDVYVRSFLFYTLIKLYYTKALSNQASSVALDWIPLLQRLRISASFTAQQQLSNCFSSLYILPAEYQPSLSKLWLPFLFSVPCMEHSLYFLAFVHSFYPHHPSNKISLYFKIPKFFKCNFKSYLPDQIFLNPFGKKQCLSTNDPSSFLNG